jgi:hypothetical protein
MAIQEVIAERYDERLGVLPAAVWLETAFSSASPPIIDASKSTRKSFPSSARYGAEQQTRLRNVSSSHFKGKPTKESDGAAT